MSVIRTLQTTLNLMAGHYNKLIHMIHTQWIIETCDRTPGNQMRGPTSEVMILSVKKKKKQHNATQVIVKIFILSAQIKG